MSLRLTLTGFSTALFSTWYFADELDLLFDCGDGFVSGVLQKSRKVKHVFISHADRDHLTGLLQFSQVNARGDMPLVFYPKDSASFQHLETFCRKFDPHVKMPPWTGLVPGDEVLTEDKHVVKAVRNEHVRVPEGITKSLSYQVFSVRRKLKPELQGLPGHKIGEIRRERGEDAVSDEIRINTLSYSGDTPVEKDGRFRESEILIHEATFLESISDGSLHGNRHSALPDVLKMVADSNIQTLILGHFSSRYPKEEIDAAILKGVQTYGIKIPVFRILPGEISRDILRQQPLNG